MAERFFPQAEREILTSLRLPLPKLPWLTIEAERLGALYDATAWPLWELLTGNLFRQFGLQKRHGKLGDQVVRERHLNFCGECATSQQRDYLVSWWCRDLNLPFVAACPIHRTPLRAAPIEQVFAGILPHEILSSEPVVSKVDDITVDIARAVIALCRESPLIDADDAIALAAQFEADVVDRIKFRRALGTSADYVFGESRVPYQPLFFENDFNNILAALVIACSSTDGMVTRLRQLSTLPLSLPRCSIQNGMRAVEEQARKRWHSNPLARLTQDCKELLNIRAQVSASDLTRFGSACIEILLLHVLDRHWLNSWFANRPCSKNAILPLSEWRCRAGMYVLMKACTRRKCVTERRPDVRKLIYCDWIVDEWNESFISRCAANADSFISRISAQQLEDDPQRFEASMKKVGKMLGHQFH